MKLEAWIIVRLLLKADPTLLDTDRDITSAIIYLTREYGLESVHDAIDAVKGEQV